MKKPTIWIVFLAAICVRILYSIAVPNIYFNPDTAGYYSLGMEMIRHPGLHTIITPFRTPLYPLFINVVMFLTGYGGSVIGSAAFVAGIQYVAAIQMLIGAIALTVWYGATLRVLPGRFGYAIIAFLLLDVLVIGWERTILTEGLAISLLMMVTALLIHTLFEPTVKNFMVLLILFILGFLLRPAFLLIPVVSLPIIAFFFRKKAKAVFLAVITLALFSFVPFAYTRINFITNGYSGIQYVGDIDILGRILESRMPVSSAKSVPYYYQAVTDYEAKDADPHPFRFLESYDTNIYSKPYRINQIGEFNRLILTHTWPKFLVSGLQNIPEVLLEVCDFIKVPRGRGPLTDAVWYLQQIYAFAQYVTFIIPIVWVVYAVLFFAKPTRWRTFVVLLGTIALSQILLTALFVYKDIGAQYGRVISVVRPHMFLFLICCLTDFVYTHRE